MKIQSPKEISKFDFNKANKLQMRAFLQSSNLNLNAKITNAPSVAEASQQLINTLIEAANHTKIPLKKPPKQLASKNQALKQLLRRRNQLHSTLRQQNQSDQEKMNINIILKNISIQISEIYQRENLETETRYSSLIKTNPKVFYKYANKNRKIKTKIGPLKHISNDGQVNYESGPKKMAEILNLQ